MNRPGIIYTVLLILCLVSVIVAGKSCADLRTGAVSSSVVVPESLCGKPVEEAVEVLQPAGVVENDGSTIVVSDGNSPEQQEPVIIEPEPVVSVAESVPVILPEPVREETVTLEDVQITGSGIVAADGGEIKRKIVEIVMPEPAPAPEFAYEPEPEKIRVHRTGSSVVHFDLGAVFIAKGHETKKFGAFFAATVTPVPVWKFLAGAKLAGGISAGTEILRGSADKSRRSMLNCFAEAMLLLKYPIAKSFEVYVGPGAEYQCFNIESLSHFSQAWGVVAQLGCRGRTSDHFGVGVDAMVHYLITKGLDFGPLLIDLRAYISVEI